MSPAFKRILAVKLADLGDLLTVTPALQALCAAHPSARIDLLAPPSSAHLLEGAPYIDRVLTFDKFPFDSLRGLLNVRSMGEMLATLVRLRLARYDALAIFHHYTNRWGATKFAVLSLASGARSRAGVDNGRGRFLNLRVADRGFGAMHEASYWLEVAAMLGADPAGAWFTTVPLTAGHRSAAARLLDEMGIIRASGEPRERPLVAIHPGAGAYSLARIWPVERFVEVARALVRDHGATVLVLGGPDEAATAGRLVALSGEEERVHSVAGHTTIHETAALLEQCDLFVGNDSGPMHLSVAVGTPVVAVFGPSNSAAWGPYTPPGAPRMHRVVVRDDLPCIPCFYRAHSLGLKEGCGPRPCLTGLGAATVLDACAEQLRSGRAGRVVHAGERPVYA